MTIIEAGSDRSVTTASSAPARADRVHGPLTRVVILVVSVLVAVLVLAFEAAGGTAFAARSVAQVINNIAGGTSPTAATITRCNGSANGGGAKKRVTRLVGTGSTESVQLAITINQCSGCQTPVARS